MILTTMIVRIKDGLPLAATVPDNDEMGNEIFDYHDQAKMLFRKLGPQWPSRTSIETGPYIFHCLLEDGVCFLVLCEKNFSKRLAYNFLEDIAREFHLQHGKKVNTARRPYTFIEFNNYIQKSKKTFMDSRALRNMNTLNSQLQDVQRIMVQNIDDVLQRGTILSELDSKTQNLSMLTHKYKKDATFLNQKSMYVKAAVCGIVVVVIMLYFWVL